MNMRNNHVSLTGTITKGPELRMTENGHAAVNFTLSVNRPAPSAASDKIRVCAWEDTARMIDENFSNGDEICVDGRLQSDRWNGADGKTHFMTRVLAETASRIEASV